MAVPTEEREVESVYFPDLDGDLERKLGNAPAQVILPRDLLIEMGALGKYVSSLGYSAWSHS